MASFNRGYVLSDLHICSPTSLYERYLSEIEAACASHSIVVLNGDTFDFKRSHLSNHSETVSFALDWVRGLLLRHPKTKFEYIIGNHDCTPLLVAGLNALARELPHLTVHATFLEIGSNIFLHGDACDLTDGVTDIEVVRERYRAGTRNVMSIIVGEVVTRLRLNIVEYVRHPREQLAHRIVTYLNATNPGFRERIRTVYFGHTHAAFSGFRYEGLVFHNTGCALRGLRFAPAEFEAGLG